jgi:hypothetical protein
VNDITVIRAYAVACGRIADQRCEDLDSAVDDFADAFEAAEAARAIAESRREEAMRALDYAERLSKFAAACMGGDVPEDSMRTAADAIRALAGPCPSIEPERAA